MLSGVPPALSLVESFLNSVDVESGQDDLEAMPRFQRWLRDHGRAAAADTAAETDLRLARELRDELRAELCAHHDGGPRDRSRLDRLAAGVRLTVRFDTDGSARLSPADGGVAGVLGEVLAAIARATHEGTWARLKICSADSCRYVYYDRSKNASRRWCSMEVCGNRQKTRAYRSRQRAEA